MQNIKKDDIKLNKVHAITFCYLTSDSVSFLLEPCSLFSQRLQTVTSSEFKRGDVYVKTNVSATESLLFFWQVLPPKINRRAFRAKSRTATVTRTTSVCIRKRTWVCGRLIKACRFQSQQRQTKFNSFHNKYKKRHIQVSKLLFFFLNTRNSFATVCLHFSENVFTV